MESQPCAAEILVPIARCGDVRIHYGKGRREIRIRQVVIGDDDANNARRCVMDGTMRPYSTIGGYDEARAACMRPIYMLLAEAVSVKKPMRQTPADVAARPLNSVHQDRGRHDPVHIVIAEHKNLLLVSDCADDSVDCPAHVREIV